MLGAGEQEIVIFQGADFIMPFQCFEEDGVTPVSLTGATVSGQIRSAPESTTIVETFTGAVTDGENGEAQVSLSNTETAAIPVDDSGDGRRKLTKYVYDIEILYSDNTKQRVLEGICFVSPEVTR